jgi:hypothetical protein
MANSKHLLPGFLTTLPSISEVSYLPVTQESSVCRMASWRDVVVSSGTSL